MKRLVLCTALVLLVGQLALATPELFLKSGTTTLTVVCIPGQVAVALTSIGPWSITTVGGNSSSPSTSPPLDIASLTATCISSTACATNPLDVWLSDTGFTTVNGSFTNYYNVIASNGGTAAQTVWVGLGNVLFQSNGSDGGPTVTGGTLVGTVGPLTGNVNGSVTGGPHAGPSPYSMTIEDVFKGNGTASVQFSTDGQVQTVPEPASVVLLGGLILFCSSRLRRRSRSR